MRIPISLLIVCLGLFNYAFLTASPCASVIGNGMVECVGYLNSGNLQIILNEEDVLTAYEIDHTGTVIGSTNLGGAYEYSLEFVDYKIEKRDFEGNLIDQKILPIPLLVDYLTFEKIIEFDGGYIIAAYKNLGQKDILSTEDKGLTLIKTDAYFNVLERHSIYSPGTSLAFVHSLNAIDEDHIAIIHNYAEIENYGGNSNAADLLILDANLNVKSTETVGEHLYHANLIPMIKLRKTPCGYWRFKTTHARSNEYANTRSTTDDYYEFRNSRFEKKRTYNQSNNHYIYNVGDDYEMNLAYKRSSFDGGTLIAQRNFEYSRNEPPYFYNPESDTLFISKVVNNDTTLLAKQLYKEYNFEDIVEIGSQYFLVREDRLGAALIVPLGCEEYTELPDLRLANLSRLSLNFDQGEVFDYTFDLINVGTPVYGDYTIQMYLSKDTYYSEDDYHTWKLLTGNTYTGTEGIKATLGVPVDLTAGFYYLILVVDPENIIEEVNDYHNELVSAQFYIDTHANLLDCNDLTNELELIGTYNGHQYFHSNKDLNIYEARALAHRVGGYLTVINDSAENDFMKNHLDDMTYIGLGDAFEEGKLAWMNGDFLSYVNLDICSFCLGNTVEYDYAVMHPWNGGWSFSNPWSVRPFIVEVDGAPCGVDTPDIPDLPSDPTDNNYTRLFPNPVVTAATLEIEATKSQKARIQIYNTQGQLKIEEAHHLSKAYNRIDLELEDLSAGIYWIRIPELPAFNRRFVKL